MVDFKRLHKIFVEEAMEKLSEIEDGLLRLEKSPDDRELINTIFRAAHTIKGSSGSIGLKDISVFAHHMEEILDMVRQERMSIDKKLIDVFLEATDMIKEMVECVASETTFDFSRCDDLMKSMEEIKRGKKDKDKCDHDTEGTENRFRIIFAPGPEILKRGIDPLIMLDDLRSIGNIVSIQTHTDSVPAISDINPENMYLRWDIMLRANERIEGIEDTDAFVKQIKKVFEFVEEDSEIKIVKDNACTEHGEEAPPIGKMLIENGIVKAADVEDALKSQKKLGEILVQQGKASSEEIAKVLEKQRDKKTESFKYSISSTIRVDLKKLDHLINTVGEMVITHSMLQQAIQGISRAGNLDMLMTQLQRVGGDIQEIAMSLRMLPVGEVFQRFTRLVRELSASKNKNIELIITGEDTELDKGVLEKITDPLVHLIRNSIDHGIETPEERLSKGKSEKGTIHLSAYHMGDSVYIDVEDDGRGLNKEKIIEKAITNRIIDPSAIKDMTDEQIYNLIFLPGFSTADKVTDISGRGVGMDVVRRNIESLNGKVYIRTTQDRGTTISIKLPLTLVVIDGLTVLIGDDVFVIPISSIIESIRPDRKDVKTVEGKGELINVRGEYIPLIRLHDLIGINAWKKNPCEAIVIVVSYERKKYCLMVDDLLGQQQIVLKSLGNATPKISDIAGGTILGDGRVALVLDVPGIVEMAER